MTSLKTSIKTITYLSDIGCLEIQGASLDNVRHNIAEKSKEKQNKVNVDLAASGMEYRERLNIPVITEQVS